MQITNSNTQFNNLAYKSVVSNSQEEKDFSKVSEKDFDKTKEDTQEGVVYEKNTTPIDAGLYKINKMSQVDRQKLVEQLKADQEKQVNSLRELAQKMISEQVGTYLDADATEFWQQLADGKYKVDEETQKKAQEAISEDGYWGSNQVSQRLFDFASALAGDDTDLMKKMQQGVLEGYQQAEKTWGKELPQLCKDTLDKTNQLFDDYFKSKQTVVIDETV